MFRKVGWRIAGAALLAVLATATGVAIASGTTRGYGQDPTGVPPGGGPPYDGSLTSLVSPSPNGVFTGGRVSVLLRSRAPAGAIEVRLNGFAIPGGLTVADGGFRASASLGGPLHPGENLITVATNWGGRFDFDSAEFVVARQVSSLASLQRVLVNGRDAPVTVSARVAPGAKFRASLNGRDASSAFTQTGDKLVALLGAADGVRYGSNQLMLTADTASARSARETKISRWFDVPRGTPIAGASADRTVLADETVTLGAARSLVSGGGGKSFSWRLVRAPRGSKAKLHRPARVNAWFEPDAPGTYRIRLTVGAHPRRAVGLGAVRAAASQSADTLTITAQANRPYGIPLESNGPAGEILYNGVEQPGTARDTPQNLGISYALIDRMTGESTASGQFGANASGWTQLLDLARGYAGQGNRLLVFNWKGALGDQRGVLAQIFKLVGGGDLPDSDKFVSDDRPGSVIGVPGAPAGSAFFTHRDPPSPPDVGGMSGYVRLNDARRLFDFVFTSFVPVDTAPPSKTTDTTSTITVGDKDYTVSYPAGGSGFHVLALDPKSLAPIFDQIYVTNLPDGAPAFGDFPLANDLTRAADRPEGPLVIVQSFGRPRGDNANWDKAASAIEKLGGTRQVFSDLNQPWAGGAGGDPTAGRLGGYAFIGRTDGTAPRTEVSYPLDNLPARLAGVLALTHTADYEPMMVSATRRSGAGSVNDEFVRIANQPPTPFPILAPAASREDAQAAENFLGGPAVMKICLPGETCDVRSAYYTKYQADWPTILAALGNAGPKCRNAAPNRRVCEQVRQQLFDEVEATNRVRYYLGPQGLQRPFGAARVSALANLGAISQAIQNGVQPPPQSPTASRALTLTSYLVRLGTAAPPPASSLASGVGAVFALMGYLTAPDNSPNLIGAEIRTTADQLGVKLAERYQLAGDQLDGLGSIIVSDYGKLMAVAQRVDADPNWVIGSPVAAREELVRAAKQTFSEALISTAYPVLYDLGRVPHLSAGFWKCRSGGSQKFLFDRNPDGGQVVQRFPGKWQPVMAVGAVRATGRGNDARIPTPPASVIDPLFAPQPLGGLDMRKLEFYAPRLFKLFPDHPAPGASALSYRSEGATPPACGDIPNPPTAGG